MTRNGANLVAALRGAINGAARTSPQRSEERTAAGRAGRAGALIS